MHFQHGTIIFSPSDLTRFMESPFASWMDRLYLEFPDSVTPDERSDELQLYADAGITHEATFVKDLETNGTDLCWIKGDFPEEKAAATRQAMSEAREIIFQAHLKLPPFAGYADFLARVSTDPVLYEVWDTKLAHPEKSNRVFRLPRKIKGGTVIPAGIAFAEVQHSGNVQGSDEEVARIVKIAVQLLQRKHTDQDGRIS